MNTDPLNLRQLPPLEPPPGLWSAIEKQVQTPKRSRWRTWAPAIAAGLALTVIVNLLMRAPGPEPDLGPAAPTSSPLQVAMTRSADLESELRVRQQGSVSASALEHLLLLETELAWVDVRLAEQPQDLELWQQRSELLAAMILRYAGPVELAFWPSHPL